MNKFAPIVIFCYDRVEHLKKTVESLLKNVEAKQSILYIYSDGYKNEADKNLIQNVRDYIDTIEGFKAIYKIKRNKNFGLANSIISGVSEVINKHGSIIVLEDDLQVSKDFILYMNKALEYYKNQTNIFSISSYCAPIRIPADYTFDTFLFNRINSWGWACWQDRWDTVDWEMSYFEKFIKDKKKRKEFSKGGLDLNIMLLKQFTGKIDSWAIRFNYAGFEQKKYTVYPVVTKVLNIGADGSGTNVGKTTKYNNIIIESNIKFSDKLKPNSTICKNYRDFFKPSIYRRIINFFKIRLYIFFLNRFHLY